MAHQYDNLMPRFGRAGNGPVTSELWGDFDVDLLAEYLLEDGQQGSGVTIDFNIDTGNHGSLVSPENSEDGNMPPMAEMPAPAPIPSSLQQKLIHVQHPAQGLLAGQQGLMTALAQAPSNFGAPNFVNLHGAMTLGLAQPQGDIQQLLFQEDPAQKRRRVDGMGNAVMTVAADGQTLMLNEQLAFSTAVQAVPQPARARKKSQVQIDRRRERNRILARRTRLRKKFFFESLQKDVLDLQKENQHLKDIVKENLDAEESQKLLDECDAIEKLPPSVMEACGELADDLDARDFNLVTSIQRSQHAFIITDPSLQDNPIVFASADFLKLTGYAREQVLGRNCRFLQGTDTAQEKVDQIRENLAKGEDVSVTLLNYKADGTPFWNKLFIASLRDAQNNIVNYIGVTVEVASPEPGDPEHGNLLPGVKTSNGGHDNDSDEDNDD